MMDKIPKKKKCVT